MRCNTAMICQAENSSDERPIQCTLEEGHIESHIFELGNLILNINTETKTILTRRRHSMNFRDCSRVNKERADIWHGEGTETRPWTASDWALALTGELGKLCNLLKKLNRVNDGIASTNNFLKDGKPMDLMSEIKTEIGDVFLYLDLLSTHLGIDLETAVIDTFNRVSDREGFNMKLPY